MEPGSEVFVVKNTDDKNVYFLGKGIYQGDMLIPNAEEIFEYHWENGIKDKVETTKEESKDLLFNSPLFKNPCIKLENGETVWGKDCWWMSEQSFNNLCKGKNVVISKLY